MTSPTLFDRSLRLRCGLLACALIASTSSFAAGVSSQFSLTGAVNRPGTYDLAALQALPAMTQTVGYLSGTNPLPQSHSYTGTSLWGVLNGAGIPVDPNLKNDLLNRVVVSTGSDGYRSVFALGELSPDFGNRASLIAYGETVGGVAQGLGADGFARVTAPGDLRGGRYVSNLVNVDLQATPSQVTGSGGGVSSAFTVSGDVARVASFDLAALQALPSSSVTVGSNTYTGVSFWDLLNTSVGLRIDPNVRNDLLGMFVVATGSDGYKVAFSLGELIPGFGNQPDLIAYAVNGQTLTGNGFARIVVPNDVKAGRYVSNLVGLEVFHAAAAVPEPQTWALLTAGLVLLLPRARARR